MTFCTAARRSSLLLLVAAVGLLSSPAATDSGAQCLNPTNVTYLAFFPCLPSDDIMKNGALDCDVFAYAAATLATEQFGLLNINMIPVSILNHQLPIKSFQEESFDDRLVLDILELVGDRSFLSALRGVIVPPSDSISSAMTEFFSTRFVNATVMGYGSTDVALDNHPEFFRTIPTDSFAEGARLLLMKTFKWYRIGIISREGTTYTRSVNNFLSLFNTYIQVFFQGMITHTSAYVNSPDEVLEQFRLNNLKIFIGYFGPQDAREVLCKASNDRYQLTTSEHVWILPSYEQPDWWKLDDDKAMSSNCSNEQMIEILNSAIFIDLIKLPPVDISLSDFQLQLISKTKELFPLIPDKLNLTPYLLHSHAVSAYDAVTQLSRALTNSIECGTYENQTLLQSILRYNILGCEWCRLHYPCNNKTDISGCELCPDALEGIGCSVPEVIDQSVHNYFLLEHGQILVSQFIDGFECPIGVFWSVYDDGTCNFINISELDTHNCSRHLNLAGSYFNVSPSCPSDFYWKGRSSAPGSGLFISSFISVPKLVFNAVLILVGLAFVGTALIFNIRWREHKCVKQSSPRLNVVMVLAAAFILPPSLITGLTYSVEYYGISVTAATVMCNLEVWILFPSVAVFFSCLLVKNWRLYRIFYNKRLRARGRFMTDRSLLVVILILTMPVLSVLVVWTSVAHPRFLAEIRHISNLRLISVSTCSSDGYPIWYGVLVGYNVVIFLMTLALSFLNAQVQRGFRKEGKVTHRALTLNLLIELPLYAVVTLVNFVFPENYEVAWWAEIVADNVVPIIILCILFVPNMVRVYQSTETSRKQSVSTEYKLVEIANDLRAERNRLKAELKQKEDRIHYLKEQRKTAAVSETKSTI